MPGTEWYQLSAAETARSLKTDLARGLVRSRAAQLLAKTGPNELPDYRRESAWQVFIRQFADFMVLVLLGATAVSALLGEVMDAVTILVIVFINATLGFVQERRAERSLAALRSLSAPTARVVRDAEVMSVRARDLVPGDLIALEAGDRVPADVRLSEVVALETDESPFTGESYPVGKVAEAIARERVAVSDQKNMAFMGTTVCRGHGRGVVVATGTDTEMGRIAKLIHTAGEEPTPLQIRLEELGRWLVAICGAACVVVFALGVLQGRPPHEMFLTAVSLAVAAIPEGLPAVVTVALAIGVQRMSRRRAIVRRLPAVETLGCTTVICSDKTGTLTKNEMTVSQILAGDSVYQVTGVGYRPEGEFLTRNGRARVSDDPELLLALEIGALCNASEVREARGRRVGSRTRGESDWEIAGDPTEAALLVVASKGGLARERLVRSRERIGEVPFEPRRKMMTVVWREKGGERRETAYTKGALDALLERCAAYRCGGSTRPLTTSERRQISALGDEMASRALRVLALAYRPAPSGALGPRAGEAVDHYAERIERDLILVGLAGMADPPRSEVQAAIRTARHAGIRTIMVTGDHRKTAEAIGQALGLRTGPRDSSASLSGRELDLLDDGRLREAVREISIFARVTPEHKLRLVRALKANGEVVAMTGDGVNDAPAIKEADIGIAMGKQGTDVAKEASSMVLADDNYATIVAAVEEGRGIYDNIRKFVRYLLTCNVGEVLTMTLAVLLKMPLPLIAIQILWMNLVTDGIPAVALGFDPPEKGTMARQPRSPREGIFGRGLGGRILVTGSMLGVAGIAAFALALSAGAPLEKARTIAFCTLVMAQMVYVFRCRREGRLGLGLPVGGNPFLLVAVLLSVLVQVAGVYARPLVSLLHTVPLMLSDWALVLALAFFATLVGDAVLLEPAPQRRSRQ